MATQITNAIFYIVAKFRGVIFADMATLAAGIARKILKVFCNTCHFGGRITYNIRGKTSVDLTITRVRLISSWKSNFITSLEARNFSFVSNG